MVKVDHSRDYDPFPGRSGGRRCDSCEDRDHRSAPKRRCHDRSQVRIRPRAIYQRRTRLSDQLPWLTGIAVSGGGILASTSEAYQAMVGAGDCGTPRMWIGDPDAPDP